MKGKRRITSRFMTQLAAGENTVTEFIKNKIQEVQSEEGREVYEELESRNSRWPLRQYEWEQIVGKKVVEINRRNLSIRSLPPDRLEELLRMAEARADDVISFTDQQLNHQGLIYHTHVRLELDRLIAAELEVKQLRASDFPYPLKSPPQGESKVKAHSHPNSPRAKALKESGLAEPEIVKKMRLRKYLCLHPSGYNLEVVRVEGDRVIVKAQNGIEMPVLFDRVYDYKWIRA